MSQREYIRGFADEFASSAGRQGAAMSIRFFYDVARYNPYTDVITFFLIEGDTMVMCNITRESLEWLENAVGLTGGQLEAAFAKHRDQIERAAMGHHRPGSQAACVLVKEDFAEECA